MARNQVSRVLCPKSHRRPLVAVKYVTQHLAHKSEMEGQGERKGEERKKIKLEATTSSLRPVLIAAETGAPP